jgi:hypothetical protein
MTDHIEAYPLQWPVGRPRAKRRQNAQFQMSLAKARDHLMNEIRLLGGRNPILSSNLVLRLDGLPRGNQSQPWDPGVAVYFTYKGKQHCFACDDWNRVEDNVRAVGKTIEALRGIARWGTGDMMERAFQGFTALPSPTQWWHVFGYDTTAGLTYPDVRDRYRKLAMQRHPDREGGTADAMAELSWAREKAREHFGLSD